MESAGSTQSTGQLAHDQQLIDNVTESVARHELLKVCTFLGQLCTHMGQLVESSRAQLVESSRAQVGGPNMAHDVARMATAMEGISSSLTELKETQKAHLSVSRDGVAGIRRVYRAMEAAASSTPVKPTIGVRLQNLAQGSKTNGPTTAKRPRRDN